MVASLVFGTTLQASCAHYAELAARLAHRMQARLRLVHVSEDRRAPIVLGTDEEHLLGTVRHDLEAEAARLRALTGAAVTVHLAAGNVVDALVSVAAFEQATALLVGGEGSPRRTLLGATAERCAQRSHVPVVTLRETARLLAWLRGDRPLRVLVGADVGRAAQAARAFAATLGAIGPVEVEVTMVASPAEAHARLGFSAPEESTALSSEAEAVLLRELTRSAPEGEAAVSLRVLAGRGSADVHIVNRSEQGGFDLVVVGQRRHSLLEQLWYGSVARGVLRASPVSVACVPPGLVTAATVVGAPRVVLVAMDFSPAAHRALAHAFGLVHAEGTVHVVHVAAEASASASEARVARAQHWDALVRIAPPDDAERAIPLERHLREGAAAAQILALAQQLGADLLVLGAHGASALARGLLGSVAQEVSQHTRIPVLLVPDDRA